MGDMMNMSGFTTGVVVLIVGALVLMVALQVFPMIVDVANTIHLMTKSSGVYALNQGEGQRFDRVAVKTTTKTKPEDFANADWLSLSAGATAASPTIVDGTACTAAQTVAILPGGQETALATQDTDDCGLSDARAAPTIRFLQDQVSLIGIVIASVALLLSLSPMAMIGGVGYMFLGKFATGMSTVSKVIIAVVGVVIGGTVLVTFVGFVDVAYAAINGSRFTVYSTGLGALATTISQFWGTVFSIGLIVLAGVFVFQGYQKIRGRFGRGNSAMSA